MKKLSRRQLFVYVTLGALVFFVLHVAYKTPSHDRIWNDSQAILPYADISDETITIYNIRNNEYRTRYEYTTNYYDKSFLLSDVVSVDYIIEPFASVAAAHTLVSFGLRDGSYFAISVEARREADEKFRILSAPFREYELMYTIVDERDALGLRAIHRDNPILLYPTTATESQAQALLLSMLERANTLYSNPEFYNLFTNSCSTNIADHINLLSPSTIGFDYRLVLPKESDAIAYELGLLDTSQSLATLRKQHDVTEAIKNFIDDPDFSTKIRSLSTTNVTDR